MPRAAYLMPQIRRDRRASAIRIVLAFIFRHWIRQGQLTAMIALAVAAATLADVLIPLFSGRLVDALAQGPEQAAAWPAVVNALVIMTLLGLAVVILRHVAWSTVVPLTLRIMSDVALEAFYRVQRFSTDWHANSFAGSTVRKITRGMGAIDMIDDVLLLALWPSAVVLLGTILLLWVRWPILGLVMTLSATIYVAVTIVLSTRFIAPAARLSNVWDTRLGGVLADSLSCNAVVKAFGAENREDKRVALVVGKWIKRTQRTWIRHNASSSLQLLLLWVIRACVTTAALLLWWTGNASAGDITYVLTSYFLVQGYLRDIGQHVNHLQRSVNEMEELVTLHNEPLGIEDTACAASIHIKTGEVRFDHVTFRYNSHETPLYEDLCITIKSGERVGLVGHSGSGKTTFVKLIQRLYDVTGGRVLIDDQNVAHATQASLRSQIAIVPQEPILFHRSLAENIAYARPGATIEAIHCAARLANAHGFVFSLPNGYQTLVGERGVKLSGGERQRIALARAFLADAPILILDEATSSLDSESEALIQEAMGRLMAGRTAIVIAHRLSTVRTLDRILVFDQGRVAEDGSHAALLQRKNGLYRRLFERQAEGVDE